MKWKDSNDTVELDAETGEDVTGGKSFSIKKDNVLYHNGQNFFHGMKTPVILLAGGVVILVVFLVWLIFGNGNHAGVQQINMLESRVKALENRIAALEPLAEAANAAAQGEKSLTELTRRIDGLQAVFTKEIDSLSKRLATVPPQKTVPVAAPVKAPPARSTAGKALSQKTTHHVVQAGETLYRIALRYNLKLDELLRLNNLKPGAEIYPGQKLLVSSPQSQ